MNADTNTLYSVLVSYGRHGRDWTARDAERAHDRDALVADIISGEIDGAVLRVIASNPSEGWSRDVSEDIARDVAARCKNDGFAASSDVIDFVEQHVGVRAANELEAA